MNALIKKEIKVLQSAWVTGLVCALITLLLLPTRHDPLNPAVAIIAVIAWVSIPGCAGFMALNIFGAEFASGTFSLLMAQSIERKKLWRIKILLLGLSSLTLLVCWWLIVWNRLAVFGDTFDSDNLLNLSIKSALLFGTVFSGALWTSLLFRQTVAAFWIMLATPGALLVICGSWLVHVQSGNLGFYLEIVLGIYCVGGFFLARQLFLRAQDIGWSGTIPGWPQWRSQMAAKTAFKTQRKFGPIRVLIKKEFQLQKWVLLMAAVIAVSHLAVIYLRQYIPKDQTALEFFANMFWIFWLILPILAGATALAEERKYNTLTTQLCLPIKPRIQLLLKISVALLLALIFGFVMPLCWEGLRILPTMSHYNINYNAQDSTTYHFFLKLLLFVPILAEVGLILAACMVTLIASSLSRSTLQALTPSLAGIIVLGFLLANGMELSLDNHVFWRGWLIYLVFTPVFIFWFWRVTARNFCSERINVKIWWQTGFGAILMLLSCIALTTLIYHRAWEKLTPSEPTHGAARLARSTTFLEQPSAATTCLQLPDGRTWINSYRLDYDLRNPLPALLGSFKFNNGTNLRGFLPGSNWVNVQVRFGQLVAIKSDGTLWLSLVASDQGSHKTNVTSLPTSNLPSSLHQYGTNHDWKSVCFYYSVAFLLKSDGTLWLWGPSERNRFDPGPWVGLQEYKPVQLGTASDWKELRLIQDRLRYRSVVLLKNDGAAWTVLPYPDKREKTNELGAGVYVKTTTYIENDQLRATATTAYPNSLRIGLFANGELRIVAIEKRLKLADKPDQHSLNWVVTDVPFSKETNWSGLAGNGRTIVGLKKDGTLWKWDFGPPNYQMITTPDVILHKAEELEPVRLGRNSDWLSIESFGMDTIALAADGTLWLWPFQEASEYFRGFDETGGSRNEFEPLLDISRKPRLLDTVFADEITASK